MYWILGLLGFVFAIAPFLFGYAENALAMWTSILLGGTVMVASLIEGTETRKSTWEYWAIITIGIGAMVAPFILGFGNATAATWMSVGIGFLIALLSGSKLYYDQTRFS